MLAADPIGQTEGECPERALWRAVLLTVLEDLPVELPQAPIKRWRRSNGCSPQRTQWLIDTVEWQNKYRNVISAREFAFAPANKWRPTVCDLAGISEEYFVKLARRKRYRVDALPMELANAEERLPV